MSDSEADGLRQAEYAALRNELVKYIDLQSRLETFTFILAGGTFTLSTSTTTNLYLATYAYPIVATFLAARWISLGVSINQIGAYIRAYHEQVFCTPDGKAGDGERKIPGWEHHIQSKGQSRLLKGIGAYSIGGFFLGTQVLAIIGSMVLHSSRSPGETFLLILDVIFTALTGVFLLLFAAGRRGENKEVA